MITFDIECVPNAPEPTGATDKAMKAYRDQAKHPVTARIIAITASFWNPSSWNQMDIFEGFQANNERRLLTEFNAWRADHLGDGERHVWVGHNILGYDCPTMMLRSMVYGLDQLARDIAPLSRWGDRWHIDTMRLFGPGANVRYVALASVCATLGIPHGSPNGGGEVYDDFTHGRHDRIRAHCQDDLKALNALVLRFHQAGVLDVGDESREALTNGRAHV